MKDRHFRESWESEGLKRGLNVFCFTELYILDSFVNQGYRLTCQYITINLKYKRQ